MLVYCWSWRLGGGGLLTVGDGVGADGAAVAVALLVGHDHNFCVVWERLVCQNFAGGRTGLGI